MWFGDLVRVLRLGLRGRLGLGRRLLGASPRDG
jgi:hypothetical protein